MDGVEDVNEVEDVGEVEDLSEVEDVNEGEDVNEVEDVNNEGLVVVNINPPELDPPPEPEPPRSVLALLPEEIWVIILGKLKNPSDLHTCYNTSSLWTLLLKQDKFAWQFKLVFPLLFRYIPKNDILKCRLVTRSWRDTVDRFLEKDQFLLYNSTTHFLFRKTVEINFGNGDEDRHSVELFRNEMKEYSGSSKNPFVSRSVHVGDLPNLLPFLKEFGVHIWHLTMSLFPEEGSPVDFCEYLLSILQLTPNLRTFQAMGYVNDEGGRIGDLQVEQDILLRYFSEHSLPPLQYLETLDLRLRDIHTNDEIVTLIDHQYLSTYGPQLQRLFVGHRINLLENPVGNQAPFSNLTDLSFMIHHADQLLTLQHQFGSCPLLVLDVILHTNRINYRRLFRSIETFRNTLKILSIRFYAQFPRRVMFGKSVQLPKRICLPFLTELRLEDVSARSDMSFDFLSGLHRLRKLEIQFSEYLKLDDDFWRGSSRKRQKILVHEHLDEYGKGTEFGMYFSNIWDRLQKLERLTLWRIGFRYRRVFSRRCFEYLHTQLRRRLLADIGIEDL